jgi:hypothetical protein
MTAYADAWNQAQTVRMWMVTAERELAAGATIANAEQAAASLGKARAAWTELSVWMARLGQVSPPAPQALGDGFIRARGTIPPPSMFDRALAAKREVLALDLVEVDRIIDWLGVKQRAFAS